jgi:hypothetical protein
MVRRLGRQYNMDVVKSKNVPKVDGEFLLLADPKRARYMFTKEVFEDITARASKQSIRPFMKNAARGLGESEFGNEYYRKGHKNYELGVRFRDRANPYIGKAQMRVTLGPEDAFS